MAGDWTMAFGLVVTAFLVALSALLLLAAWQSRRPQSRPSIFDQAPSQVASSSTGTACSMLRPPRARFCPQARTAGPGRG